MKIEKTTILNPQVSIRWLTIACFEIRVGDFTVLIDPCVGVAPNAPFGPEVIDRADVILLSHGHWDHITDIRELMDRFDCPLLCGELTAPSMVRWLDCNPCQVYPMTPDLELDFGGAKIRALFGRHTDQHKPLSALEEHSRQNPIIDSERMMECDFYGHLEYRNYLITTPSGLKVLFWGNNVTAEQLNVIRDLRPDIALLQYTKQKPEELAAMCAAGGVKVLIPHHMDLVKTDEEYAPALEVLEAEVKKAAPDCLVIAPERLRRYDFGLCVMPG